MFKKCSNHPDRFYFVYEKFTSKENQRNITHDVNKVYMIVSFLKIASIMYIYNLLKNLFDFTLIRFK